MDLRDGALEQPDWYTGVDWSLDWAQDKHLEKNARYAHHLDFIFWLSREWGKHGPQPNTNSRSGSEAPQSRKPAAGRTHSRD